MPLQAKTTHEHFVHVQILVGGAGRLLHVVNLYLPPKLPNFDTAWALVLQELDAIPPTDPVLLVGDFNARMGATCLDATTPCAVHGAGCPR